MKSYPNLRAGSFLILAIAATVLTWPVTAESSLCQLGDSGWSVAVNPEWEISATVADITDRAVTIEIQKRFVGQPDEYGLMPAMYLDFVKDSEQAVQQIIITDEYIVNDTSENWIDFHIELANPLLAGFCYRCIPSGDQFETVTLSGTEGYM